MNAEEIKEIVLSKRFIQEPNVVQKASALGRSLAKWAGNRFAKVDQTIYDKRLSVCRGCEHWVEGGNIGLGKCKVCGCGRGKLWLGHEKCPIGRWSSEPLTPPAPV